MVCFVGFENIPPSPSLSPLYPIFYHNLAPPPVLPSFMLIPFKPLLYKKEEEEGEGRMRWI